ncbi:MAG: hypothetical protein OXG11_09825, partial [Chloroflexi bacterium]|nr:hypothetical protein [Chloroflexota bacterium]
MQSVDVKELMLVVKARNEAAEVLEEVQKQLLLIVDAAKEANLAISEICAAGGGTSGSDNGQGGFLDWLKDNAVDLLGLLLDLVPYLRKLPDAYKKLRDFRGLEVLRGLRGLRPIIGILGRLGPALALLLPLGGVLAGVSGFGWIAIAALIALAAAAALVWLNWDTIVESGQAMLDWFQQDMVPFFQGLPELLGGIFQNVAVAVTGALNDVITVVEGMANGVIEAINGIITAWNSLEFSIDGGSFLGEDIPSLTLGTPDLDLIRKISIQRIPIPVVSDTVAGVDIGIPAMASGGIIRRPTLALVGEAGPEAVVPLGRRGAGIAPPINVTIVNRGTLVHDRQFVDL